jgi:hypothetical protein
VGGIGTWALDASAHMVPTASLILSPFALTQLDDLLHTSLVEFVGPE